MVDRLDCRDNRTSVFHNPAMSLTQRATPNDIQAAECICNPWDGNERLHYVSPGLHRRSLAASALAMANGSIRNV